MLTLLAFREMMWEIVYYFYKMQTSEVPLPDSNVAKVEEFKSGFLSVLANALTDASKHIYLTKTCKINKEQ